MSVHNKQTLTANSESLEVTVIGPVNITVSGDFGSGYAQLKEWDTEDFVAVRQGKFYSAYTGIFDYPRGAINRLKFEVANATNPTIQLRIQSGESYQG